MPEPDGTVEPRTAEQMIKDQMVGTMPPEGSGLHNILADFLSEDTTPNYIEEIKGLPEMDRINLTSFFQQDEWKPEDLPTMELTDASREKLTGLFPDVFSSGNGDEPPLKPGEEPGGDILPSKKLEEMEPTELIAEFKKQQSLAGTRFTEIEKLNKAIKELESVAPNGELDVQEDFKALSSDFIGNYDKVRGKYNLPKIDILKAQLVAGDDVARVKQWQESELRGLVEKKHEMIEGEFSYDPTDASQAGTASYDWDDMTSKKRLEINRQRDLIANRNADLSRQAKSRQEEDYKWYADAFEDGDIEKVNSLVSSMNETVTNITTGKEESTKHPFAMRNILKGFYFNDLVKTAVESAVKDLNAEYAKNQMYLPGNELPTDLTKSGGQIGSDTTFTENDLKQSPMLSSLNFTLVEKK